MFGHCFYCILDTESQSYYNKNTQQFDLKNTSDPPLLTLEEAQEIVKDKQHKKIVFHENT